MIVDELVTMDFETFSQQDLDPDPEVEDWDGEYGISRAEKGTGFILNRLPISF